MNPFEHHGLRPHLSPSALNKYIESPGLWALQYLGHAREASNAKMLRGQAVEAGYAAYLATGRMDEALALIVGRYWFEIDKNLARGDLADKQAKLLEPMFLQCLQWTPPSALNATQIEVEYWFDDVPVKIKGIVDLAFDVVDVDLKTKEQLKQPSAAEIRQVSLYRAAREREGGLLIVTHQKHAYHPVTDEMMKIGLEELHDAARKITKLLSAFDKAEDILGVLPIDWDHWKAPKKSAFRTASALEDFTAVELET